MFTLLWLSVGDFEDFDFEDFEVEYVISTELHDNFVKEQLDYASKNVFFIQEENGDNNNESQSTLAIFKRNNKIEKINEEINSNINFVEFINKHRYNCKNLGDFVDDID